MTPGRTTLTRMPCPASSLARPRDIVSRDALLAAKWTQFPGAPVLTAYAEESVTMPPPPPPFFVDNRRAASRAHRKAPKTSVRKTFSSSLADSSASVRGGPAQAALLTRPPSGPRAAVEAEWAQQVGASRLEELRAILGDLLIARKGQPAKQRP